MAKLFENKISPSLILKIQEVANKLNIPFNHLIAVIELETAGTFSPSITNSLGYVGLIQFGKAAAKDIGTTRADLKKMSAVEQMDYVYKYLVRYKSKIHSYVDLYLAIFFPLAMGKGNDFVLQTKRLTASRVAKANPLFDINKDGQITVAEIEEKLLKRIPENFKESLKKKEVAPFKKVLPGGTKSQSLIWVVLAFVFSKPILKMFNS